MEQAETELLTWAYVPQSSCEGLMLPVRKYFTEMPTQVHQKIKQQISNNHIAIFGKNRKQAYGKFHGVSYKP